MQFDIRGSLEGISKEEIRAIFNACDVVLQYHNVKPSKSTIIVKITKRDLGLTKTGDEVAGNADFRTCVIQIRKKKREFSALVTIVLHEMIHLYFRFPNDSEEKLTSTLTSKLKMDVVRIANVLVENTYQRAGYIAHTKISYKPKGKDFYDDKQYHKDHEQSKGAKYRYKGLPNLFADLKVN